MGANGCMTCLRWTVFVLNLLFWLAGMGTLGTALWLRFDPEVSNYMKLHSGLQDFYIGCYILIAVGALMSLLGFLGCCGALRKSQCMLTSFFILLVVVFCGQLACAILAYTHQDTVKSYLERSMYDTVYHHYYRKQTFTDVFDGIQSTLQCCGVHSYKDWLHSYYATQVADRPELGVGASDTGRVPESCCNEQGKISYPNNCGREFDKMPLWTYHDFLHPKGCSDMMYEKMYQNLDIMIGLAVGIGAFQLLGMILSMLLCCWVNNRKEEDRKTGRYD